MSTFKKGVTVLICTHNGAAQLPATFDYLAKQKASNVAWEVLVVDNASSDNTAALARQLADGIPAPVRITSEPVKGKEQALYTGLRQAHYQYVIVCDDDNWLEENYVSLAFHIMEEHPDVGLLGGRGTAVFSGTRPAWFFEFQSFYAVGRQARQDGYLDGGKDHVAYLWGASSVINRAAIELLNQCGYQPVLTYADFPGFRCEDYELCLAIQMTGYRLMYDSRLLFHHHITADRLRWSYLMANSRAGGLGAVLLQPYLEVLYPRKPGQSAKQVWRTYLAGLGGGMIGRQLVTPKGWKLLAAVLARSKGFEGRSEYQVMVVDGYRLYGAWRVRRAFKALYSRLVLLKEKLAAARQSKEIVRLEL